MMTNLELSASLEDYLEAIFHIASAKGAARPKDIAHRLGVNNSSVTGALRALSTRQLVNYAPYDVVTLTDAGNSLARDVIRRHEALKNFFVRVLSVDDSLAEDAACKMEHEIPREIVERLVHFADFVEICPRGGAQFIEGFGYHCESGCGPEGCDRCVAGALDTIQDRRAGLEGGILEQCSLDQLPTGSRAKIIRTSEDDSSGKDIHDCGFTPGAVVEVENIEQATGVITVNVRGHHLSLHRSEAKAIVVEELDSSLVK